MKLLPYTPITVAEIITLRVWLYTAVAHLTVREARGAK